MPLHRVDPEALAATAGALVRLREDLQDADDDLLTAHLVLGDRAAEETVLAWLDGIVDATRAIGESARDIGSALRRVGADHDRADVEVTGMVTEHAE